MPQPHMPDEEIATWSSPRLREWIAAREDPAPNYAYWWWRVRHMAQSRVYNRKLSADERCEWAATMLAASECEQRFGRVKPWDGALDRFTLRTYIIVNLRPVPGDDEMSDPVALARDVLGTLTLAPKRARELAEHWRMLPIEQMQVLRQHKNMLRPLLPELVDMLPDGDLATLVHEWLDIRPNLPLAAPPRLVLSTRTASGSFPRGRGREMPHPAAAVAASMR